MPDHDAQDHSFPTPADNSDPDDLEPPKTGGDATDLDARDKKIYGDWKKRAYRCYCLGEGDDFRRDGRCPYLNLDRKVCRLFTERNLGEFPDLCRCFDHVFFTVLSRLSETLMKDVTNYDGLRRQVEALIRSNRTDAASGTGFTVGVRDFHGADEVVKVSSKPFKGFAGNVVLLIILCEAGIVQHLTREASRRICGNCRHYSGDPRSCAVDPDRDVTVYTVVPALVCLNCTRFIMQKKARRGHCTFLDLPRPLDGAFCTSAVLKHALPACISCDSFRTKEKLPDGTWKPVEKCLYDPTRSVSAASPMCDRYAPKRLVECRDFAYPPMVGHMEDVDTLEVPAHPIPEARREMLHLMSNLDEFANDGNGPDELPPDRCRRLMDFMTQAMNLGRVDEAKRLTAAMHGVAPLVLDQDLRAMRGYLTKGVS
ncbi:MAG: hypothetical protein V2B18_12615 [Pseudomonadota bacterium]